MKHRAWFLVWLGVAVLGLGIAAYALSAGRQGPPPVLAGTINRDCAPWDGPAFTVSIPLDGFPKSSIDISIWQSPDIRGRAAFSFPDDTGHVGTADLVAASGQREALSGRVILNGVDEGSPVEGSFDFKTESGRQFAGRFSAPWGEFRALCG